MVKQRVAGSFASKFLLLVGATVLAFAAVGCAAGVENDEADLEETPTLQTQTLTSCLPGQFGYYTCPSTLEGYDYSAPGCGEMKKPTALSVCNSNCSVACVDSGWGG